MIEVNICRDTIAVRGHAGYAAQGYDIVCAGVSALFQTLLRSIEDLTEDLVEYSLAPGKADMHFRNLSEKSETLIDSFFIGVSLMAEEYPEYVRIV